MICCLNCNAELGSLSARAYHLAAAKTLRRKLGLPDDKFADDVIAAADLQDRIVGEQERGRTQNDS
jgi:hypothetical protein